MQHLSWVPKAVVFALALPACSQLAGIEDVTFEPADAAGGVPDSAQALDAGPEATAATPGDSATDALAFDGDAAAPPASDAGPSDGASSPEATPDSGGAASNDARSASDAPADVVIPDSGGAPTVVQTAVFDVGNVTQTTAKVTLTGVTAGDTLVVYLGTGNDGSQTFSWIGDAQNAYTEQGTSSALGGLGYVVWAYAATGITAPGGALTITATFGASSTNNFMIAVETTPSSVDVWSGFANGSGTTATSPAAQTHGNDLVIALAAFDNGGETSGSGFALAGNAPKTSAFAESRIVTTPTSALTATAAGNSGAWLIGFVALEP